MKPRRVSDAALQRATGRGWEEWRDLLETVRAASLSHQGIVAELEEHHGVGGWWAQTLAVEFERSIGRRELGQTCRGSFATSSTRALHMSKDEALDRWQTAVKGLVDVDGIPFAVAPTVKKTDKWRYWRVPLRDGSRVTVNISESPTTGNAVLSVQHEKLTGTRDVERWKAYWKKFLEGL